MLTPLLQALAKPYFYGGQAVLEGVMMRGHHAMAVAVRRSNGEIVVHEERLRGLYAGVWRNVPLVRGVIVLAETLTLGMRALLFSTNVQLEEDGEAELHGGAVAATLGVSLAFIAGVFFVTPLALAWLLERLVGGSSMFVFEGLLRLAMFLGYVKLIGMLPDIRRTFAYHGAEHRTIHAYEADAPLLVERVRAFPNAHPRCGTGFLLVVMVVAIAVFTAVGHLPWPLLIASRLALLPVVAAIAYEIVRFSATFWRFRLVRLVFRPSLALQSFTTRDPADDQIEVAIAALHAVLEADRVVMSAPQGKLAPAAS